MQLWPHLQRGIAECWQAEADGFQSVCFVSPTGGGKRSALVAMATQTRAEGKKSIIYTNRRLITAQTTGEMGERDIEHGMLAAGYETDLGKDIAVASIQTVMSRRGLSALPFADRVFIDEGHSTAFHPIIPEYLKMGSRVYLFTATPIGLKGVVQKLVIAGTNQELRELGALVPCITYSPLTPAIKGVRRWKVGTRYVAKYGKWFNEYRTFVFANLFEQWKKLNPWAMPCIVFAPGVAESQWIVEEFKRRGVEAAHIDGNTTDSERHDIEWGSRENRFRVVSSCGVMREGADWGWLHHGVGLQAWESLRAYLQCVGRVLRAWPDKEEAILHDYSGAYFRHGSPNENREWKLDDTELTIARRRFRGYKTGAIQEPIRCPNCGMERKRGGVCPGCNHQHERSVRMVSMGDGELTRVTGKLVKSPPKTTSEQKTWISCLFICGNSNRTLGQASVIFHQKTGQYPPTELRPQPAQQGDPNWHRKVKDVYPQFVRKKETA